MAKTAAKQIDLLMMASLQVAGLSFTAGASLNVTAALTTAAATAGRGSIAVPVQVASTVTPGFVTSGSDARVEMYNATTKQKIDDNTPAQNEVYGRLTQASGVYTLTTYVLIAGVETAYPIPVTTPFDIEVNYQFELHTLPANAFIGVQSRNVDNDSGGGGGRYRYERVTVTGANTLVALSVAYAGSGIFKLHINGKTETALGGGTAPFTVAGTAITWSAVNAGYALATTDIVEAEYAY
jgi:hypothetical protein